MYDEEIHFGKVLLKQSGTVLAHLTPVTFHPMTPNSIGFLYYQRRMCGLSLKKVSQEVVELLIRNKKVTDVLVNGPTCAKQGHN